METIAIISFVIGLLIGVLIAFVLRLVQAKTAQELANEIFNDAEKRRKDAQLEMLEAVKNNFSRLSTEALTRSTDQFIKLAHEKFSAQTERHNGELNTKKQLIDQQLVEMEKRLREVTDLVQSTDTDRQKQYGALEQQLTALNSTAHELRITLKDNRERGQWGERIAEQILQTAGFIEGINYTKQETNETSRKRPDFSFKLPNNLMLNMDCKFPLDNYVRCINSQVESERQTHRENFLKDVRTQVKQITSREYVNVEQSTVDCVLMFIPNESLMRFIHDEDPNLVDEALKSKVILCSPLTLFVVLAVIRQAAQNFALEQSSRDVLKLLSEFKKQWGEYNSEMTKVGSQIDRLQETYNGLVTTRKNKLDKPLNQVDELLKQYDEPLLLASGR